MTFLSFFSVQEQQVVFVGWRDALKIDNKKNERAGDGLVSFGGTFLYRQQINSQKKEEQKKGQLEN